MGDLPKLEINVNERFEHLPRAPIVEAVIDIRGRATQPWEEKAIRSQVECKLEGYKYLDSQKTIEQSLKFGKGTPPRVTFRDLGLKGVRFQSPDKKQIAQFNRDGFVFSRLEPYQDWEHVFSEGLRVWRICKEIAQPAEIERIGLRFINRIEIAAGNPRLEDYLNPAPQVPRDLDLPFSSFVHQDVLAVPGQPYQIKLIRTIQPPTRPQAGIGLILDIDVMASPRAQLNDAQLQDHLISMRWLKNKMFFGSITQKALENFR